MWKGVSTEYQDLKPFDGIKEYAAEYQDYQNEGEAYYDQKCEEDARKYSEQRSTEMYYSKINEYLGISDNAPLVEYYDENGDVLLLDASQNRIAGPYKYIEDSFDWAWMVSDIARYIGENGLWGFLNIEGTEITPPIFIKASHMEDGAALVSDEQGSVYYIDSKGKRISRNYPDAHPFEHEGYFARVKLEDGKWAIINRQDEIVFSGADSIAPLPDIQTIGSAVVDGQAVLFQLNALDEAGDDISAIMTFEDFVEISYIDGFAIVKNEFGQYGVVNLMGDLVIEDKYYSLKYDDTISAVDSDEKHVVFQLQNADGTYEVVKMVF